MYPVLVQVAGLTVFSFGTFLLVGIILGVVLFRICVWWLKLPFHFAMKHFFWVVMAGLLLGKIFAVFRDVESFSANPYSLFFFWQGGFFLPAFFVGSYITLKKVCRRFYAPCKLWLDALLLPVLLTSAVGLVGYFLSGRGLGGPTMISWLQWSKVESIESVFGEVPLHPLSLYLAGYFIILIIAILYLKRFKKYFSLDGAIAYLFYFLYFLGFGVFELLRNSSDVSYIIWGLRWSAVAYILLALCSLALFGTVQFKISFSDEKKHKK